jgi:DNA modification methylase
VCNEQIDKWEREYRGTGDASTVDFRSLAGEAVTTDRYTHLLHPYPAKLLPHIPFYFLRSSLLSEVGASATVADPFCGSGTVLLEAALHGCSAVGADTNPLARLIARVKLRPIPPSSIEKALQRVNRLLPTIRDISPPSVVNIETWYRPETVAELAKLRVAIKAIRPRETREFMQVCFSVCARKVSLADPRLSVPVRINLAKRAKYGRHFRELNVHIGNLTKLPVIERFNYIVRRNADRMALLYGTPLENPNVLLLEDAMNLHDRVPAGEIDLIITSPPYVGAQKYIRASSLSLGWLDMAYEGQLRSLERKTVGREHLSKDEIRSSASVDIPHAEQLLDKIHKVYPLRSHIARTYLIEMKRAFQSMYFVLKPGAHLVLVTGPNTVCGFHFDTPAFLEHLAMEAGFTTRFKLVDHIRSRGLMTKRNKSASIIASEVVLCMRKTV